MSNLPSTISSIPAPTPQIAKSLSQHELQEHRAKIAFEVRVMLHAYYEPNESDEVKSGMLAWFCDELQDWTLEQVVWSLRHWNRENPRRRPTPGDVLSILKLQRGKAEAAKMASLPRPAPEPREPVTPERATEILAQVGFRPRRIEGAIE